MGLVFKDFYRDASRLREALRSLFPNGWVWYFVNGEEVITFDSPFIFGNGDFTVGWWLQEKRPFYKAKDFAIEWVDVKVPENIDEYGWKHYAVKRKEFS